MGLLMIALELIGGFLALILILFIVLTVLGSIICFSLPLLEYWGEKVSKFSYDVIKELEREKD